jgi:hypothetical protein
VDVSINTVTKLLVDTGTACAAYHKAKNVPTAKQAPEAAGDVWTWTSVDAKSKLICNWFVGGRDSEYALAFMEDLKSRLANRV